jgi:predicted extracellular nuclease
LKVAALNLLNYFNSFTGCTNGVGGPTTDCRGAGSAAEFDRQWPKTVAAVVGTGADVVGVIEIENDGYGPESGIAHLVARLNAATAPGTYAFVDADAATGQTNALGTDAIKVGLIYKPASVTPVGTTAALNSDAFVTGGDAAPRNRPALAQAFEQRNRARFVVTVNHLKSKGSACTAPDAGDGQGNCNGVRTNAAKELLGWLATDPTNTGDPDVLIVGDLNSYAKEDPITALIGGGYADLIAARIGRDAYSYAFDGQWGYLDHALASSSLASQVTGVAEWHVNADEPSVLDYNTEFKSAGQVASLYAPDQFRVADHDPVLVGLNLPAAPEPYPFAGFFPPVANAPVVNQVNAGRTVAVQFSLGGDRGLSVLAAGYPAMWSISCASGAREGVLAGAESAGGSGLTYDAATDRYTYAWKTEKGWANSCRELVVRLSDGTQHSARFRFTR